MLDLTSEEVRILGCLAEKEATTPDNYPLTVNSLTSACNQSTNRHPVVRYTEGEVTAALTHLRELGFTRIVYSQSNRAPKHRHVLHEQLKLEPAELAALGVLMLRGPQTVGEVKGRTERIFAFADLAHTEATLDALAAREDPLVVRLARRPGQKDARYAHLIGGPVDAESFGDEDAGGGLGGSAATSGIGARAERVADLEGRVAELESRLAELSTVVDRLRPLLDD